MCQKIFPKYGLFWLRAQIRSTSWESPANVSIHVGTLSPLRGGLAFIRCGSLSFPAKLRKSIILKAVFTFNISWILLKRRRPNSQWSNHTCCISYTDQQAWYWPNKSEYSVSSFRRVNWPSRRHGYNFRSVILKSVSGIDILSIWYRIDLSWMSQNPIGDRSTLVHVMAWCHQVPSHYLNQCWPRSFLP